jgi:hypothetical protein
MAYIFPKYPSAGNHNRSGSTLVRVHSYFTTMYTVVLSKYRGLITLKSDKTRENIITKTSIATNNSDMIKNVIQKSKDEEVNLSIRNLWRAPSLIPSPITNAAKGVESSAISSTINKSNNRHSNTQSVRRKINNIAVYGVSFGVFLSKCKKE